MNYGVVILAAGASRRMGKPKLLLPWGDKTILEHQVDQWRSLGASTVAVVVAPDNVPVVHEVDGLGLEAVIYNPQPDRGMFSSIQCAASWPGWGGALDHWVISLGDQPHIPRSTLEQFLDLAALHPEKICQPTRGGRARHPVMLPRANFLELAASHEAHLKAFLDGKTAQRAFVEIEDPALDLDLDTPEDYRAAMERFL